MSAFKADQQGVHLTCPACGQINRVAFERLGASTRCGNCKKDLSPVGEPIEVSDPKIYSSLMRSDLPVLIDFWAEWCGPCKMMAPELDRFARENAGRVAVAKINTEQVPTIAQQFQITAIPTLSLSVGGREVGRVQGARSSAQLEAFVRETVPSARS